MNESKRGTPQAWVDPDDAPELDEDFFEQADFYVGDKLVRRGRPKSASPKVALTVRYDADIIAAFRATGPGWQTRMNDALRQWLAEHSAASEGAAAAHDA